MKSHLRAQNLVHFVSFLVNPGGDDKCCIGSGCLDQTTGYSYTLGLIFKYFEISIEFPS